MSADLPEQQLRQVSPATIRLYAVQSGWVPRDGVKRPVILLNHPTDDLTQIQIPLSGDARDFTFLMGEAVRTLAAYEKRPAFEVLGDLITPSSDVIRISVQSRDADAGTLPLDEGLKILHNGRDLLLAAACSAHQPQAYFRSLSYGPAMDFIRSCRLGQTERGSYVATIMAPVAPDLTPSLFDAVGPELETEPYERKVTLVLMHALQSLRSTLDRGRVDDLLRSVPSGVSANLCESLAAMSPADDHAAVSVGLSWSRNRPRVPKSISNRVRFAQSELAIIREAGRRLMTVKAGRVEVDGHIIELKARDSDLFESFRGSVTIRAIVGGRQASVKFQLPLGEYQQACDAHRDRRRVAISGIPHGDAQSRVFTLILPQGFRVLAQDVPQDAVPAS